MRMILGRILEGCGFEVQYSGNGRHALDRFEAHEHYELVLVDWRMPVMTGIELIRAVRANPAWNDTRLVMVTAEVETERMREALSAGANDYVTKPFTRDVMLAKIASLGLAI
jgi:two-component system chemotaxis response regulator CheY